MASASSAPASKRATASSSTGSCGRGRAPRSARGRERSRRRLNIEPAVAMNLSHFFVHLPIFATVLSVFVIIVGAAAYFTLPVAQYPEIAPPTIVVTASYPGASAEVVSDTVSTPLEQEINGVENMLYMNSQATADGNLQLTITFALGTDLDISQVLVQNRVSIAEPKLPEEVRRLGITVKKNSPDMLMVIHLSSPEGSRDQLYISNYATLQVKDVLARLDGVGDVRIFGARDYAMRIWLDPDKVAARNLTAGEVVAALQAQNVQVASGVLNQPPTASRGAFQLNVETLGRLADPRQFANIVVRNDPNGRVTRIRDVGRVELGAQDYGRQQLPRRAASRSDADLPASGLECTGDGRSYQGVNPRAGAQLSERPSIRHRLQPDRVHRGISLRGGPASHSPTAARVCSVISNCTGRPVFFWTTVVRSRTLPLAHTSSIFSLTRSQPLSLLSIARLNMARSRRRFSIWRRTRMVQTSFGFNGRFWPTRRPLFHGSR